MLAVPKPYESFTSFFFFLLLGSIKKSEPEAKFCSENAEQAFKTVPRWVPYNTASAAVFWCIVCVRVCARTCLFLCDGVQPCLFTRSLRSHVCPPGSVCRRAQRAGSACVCLNQARSAMWDNLAGTLHSHLAPTPAPPAWPFAKPSYSPHFTP